MFTVLTYVTLAFSLASCEAAPASGWSVQRTPKPAGAKGSRLSGVSCVSRTACTAVGIYANRSGHAVTLAEQWNGTSWLVQRTPNPADLKVTKLNGVTLSELSGLSCLSTTACTAVGVYVNSAGAHVSLVEHWNGTSWTVQRTPNPAGARDSELFGVSCVSMTACTAVGYTNSAGKYVTLVERWNGSSWSVRQTPNPAGATFSKLSGVSCASTTACTAVGHYTNRARVEVTLAERWNGSSWTVQRTPNPGGVKISENFSELFGVSCVSSTACTAVGNYASRGGTGGALVERWNGTSWTVQRTPSATAGELLGVSCVSMTVCTAVGGAGTSAGYAVTLAERWNGTSWTIQRTPNPAGAKGSEFLGVACVSKRTCTAVGNSYINAGPPVAFVERYS